MELAKAVDHVMATVDTLQDFRQDSAWAHLYEYVVWPISMESSNCKGNRGDSFQVGYNIQFY